MLRPPCFCAAVVLLLLVTNCSGPVEIGAPELRDVVERDAVAFAPGTVADVLVERLSGHKVAVVGESHQLREHHQFLADLAIALRAHDFDQVLLECPQMADWLIEDYVSGKSRLADWIPPVDLFGTFLTAIRDHNRLRPEIERIRVYCLDVNLDDYGGTSGFRYVLESTPDIVRKSDVVRAFLAAPYETPREQHAAISELRNAVDHVNCCFDQNAYWSGVVRELAEFEELSIDIRADRSDHYDRSVVDREAVIKQIADRRIAMTASRTLINVGDTHAQKKRLMGSKIEWLGDYLVHRSPASGGDVYVMASIAAKAVSADGSSTDERLAKSADNEVFRIMYETGGDRVAWLPLDDPLFARNSVRINFEEVNHRCTLRDHFDGLLLHPVAHIVSP